MRGKDNQFQLVTKKEGVGSSSEREVSKGIPGVL